jgi:hypothetical protein
MKDLILHLQEKLVISTEQAGILHAAFDNLQLSIFQNAKDNLSSTPTGRRYSDEVKESALTLYFYSPKAYRYVRCIIPLQINRSFGSGHRLLTVNQVFLRKHVLPWQEKSAEMLLKRIAA